MPQSNIRPDYDRVIKTIADYVQNFEVKSDLALQTARYCLLDSLACGFMALSYPECTKLLGPIIPEASLSQGACVPGTVDVLDPVRATFNLGTMIRWLDFNDTWLAAEWGHPSDNLSGILMTADYLNRQKNSNIVVGDILKLMIKAYEIQGVLALENSFNRVGLDHVLLVKIASTAVVSKLLGADFETLCSAISLALVDGQSLRTYRHSPNTGSRKSWAAGDAASRAVFLAMTALRGEAGCPSALTAKQWGFYDVSFKGKSFKLSQDYNSYVMENILFKISFPAEFHAQTAVEAAIFLHKQVRNRIDEITKIIIETQESAIRIIDKVGPLHNPADRDHCLQYMVACGLIFGEITAEHYESEMANDSRIDFLRDKMQVVENPRFTKEYLDPQKRSIGNAIQVFFKEGTKTEKVTIDYPVGHRVRRAEGVPLLLKKFKHSVNQRFNPKKAEKIHQITNSLERIDSLPVHNFIDLFI